jgi:hypothetical protein
MRAPAITTRPSAIASLRAPAPATAAVLVAVWLLVDPRTPDLAAQVYRVELFRAVGFSIWDLRWYGGHALPGYSLLFPALGALLGMRLVAALAVLASAALAERLLLANFGEVGRWGAVWFAVAALADIWIGRLTFALGVTFALASYLAFMRVRPSLAAVAALLCAAASPVAGVLLALAALTHSLLLRTPRAALAIAAPALTLVGVLALLFPEGGWEPYPTTSFAATLAVILAFLWALPTDRRSLRVGAVVYLAACVASVALHTPMGANIERYGLLLAGPLLLCALLSAPGRECTGGSPDRVALGDLRQCSTPSGLPHRKALSDLRRRAAPGGSWPAPGGLRPIGVLVVLSGIALWTLWGPVRETAAVAGDPSTEAAYYAPVAHFMAAHGGEALRVEVPFTRSHWEAAWLAPSVSLARGWEKQLDTRYDDVLLRAGLTSGKYLAWLHQQAVSYVALPDAPLDPSSAQEGRLIRSGLWYLREVFTSTHWRIYRVLDATPLLQGPGRLLGLDHDSFALRAAAPGGFLIRVHYTRYWTVTEGGGGACVASAPGGWTAVFVRHPGKVVVTARFSPARGLGLASTYPCGVSANNPV